MVSPFLFFADERLSLAELTAACLDGALVPLGEGFIPADAAETRWMRARSLAPLLGGRWAAVRLTAAWVHGGIAGEPAIHHLQRVRDVRVRPRCDPRAVFHDVRLPVDDVESIAGVPVSTPARTLGDLARSDDREEQAAARAWAYRDPLLRAAAETWFERHPRFPHAHRATRLLRAVAAADDVTAEESTAEEVTAEEVTADRVTAVESAAEEATAEGVTAEEVTAEGVTAEESMAEYVAAERSDAGA